VIVTAAIVMMVTAMVMAIAVMMVAVAPPMPAVVVLVVPAPPAAPVHLLHACVGVGEGGYGLRHPRRRGSLRRCSRHRAGEHQCCGRE
jgi:hypothetical protein